MCHKILGTHSHKAERRNTRGKDGLPLEIPPPAAAAQSLLERIAVC